MQQKYTNHKCWKKTPLMLCNCLFKGLEVLICVVLWSNIFCIALKNFLQNDIIKPQNTACALSGIKMGLLS